MSLEVTSLVWRTEFPAMDRIVLLRLADFADSDGGNVYPSVGRVARECGVSERHVQGVLKKFTASGLLMLVRAGGGRNRPAEYRINLGVLKGCIPCGELPLENPAHHAPNQPKTPHTMTETPQATTENPAHHAPNPSVNSQESVSAVAAAAPAPDAHAVGSRVLGIMGVTNDPRWYGNSSRVAFWLSSGADPEADIYPTVTRLMAQRKGEPPRSLRYFDAAIADAVRNRTTPLTTGGHHDLDHNKSRQPRRRGYDPDESRRRTLAAFPDIVGGGERVG